MKRARSILTACVVVLVVAGAWYAAARISSLEGRVKELEATFARLQTTHRALLQELLYGSAAEQVRARTQVAQELAGVPEPTAATLAPATTERNLPPTAPHSR
jgi:outer membrane murein-binding lipoprotein Lpp